MMQLAYHVKNEAKHETRLSPHRCVLHILYQRHIFILFDTVYHGTEGGHTEESDETEEDEGRERGGRFHRGCAEGEHICVRFACGRDQLVFEDLINIDACHVSHVRCSGCVLYAVCILYVCCMCALRVRGPCMCCADSPPLHDWNIRVYPYIQPIVQIPHDQSRGDHGPIYNTCVSNTQ